MADSPDAIELAPGCRLPASAVGWSFARSSGPGGQNVNKVNTKAVLHVALDDLKQCIGPGALLRLKRLAVRYIVDDQIVIAADDNRSQLANREAAIERLSVLVRQALVVPKKRRKTKPTRASKERRIKAKKEHGDKKRQRRQRFD